MASDDQARAAVEALNGKPFGGRPLTVSEARERAPGGGAAAVAVADAAATAAASPASASLLW